MTEEECVRLIAFVKKAVKAKGKDKVYYFQFMASDAGGTPWMTIDKVAATALTQRKAAKKTATDARWAAGALRRDASGSLVFARSEGNLSTKEMAKLLAMNLAKDPSLTAIKTHLQNIPVVDGEGAPRATPPNDTTPAETQPSGEGASEELARARKRGAKLHSKPDSIPLDKLEAFITELADQSDLSEELAGLLATAQGELSARKVVPGAVDEIKPHTKRLKEIALDFGSVNSGYDIPYDVSGHADEVRRILDALREIRGRVASHLRQ